MDKLEKILKEIRPNVSGGGIIESKDLVADLNLDSFDIMIIIDEIEKKYNTVINIADVHINNFKTMESIYNIIKKNKENL